VQYLRAQNLKQALSRAAEAAGEGMKFLAGGTDLCVQIAEGAVQPTLLIDISEAEELRGVEQSAEGVRIGAALTIAELLEASGAAAGKPAEPPPIPRCLLQGAASIGSPQIRHLGTIGGNVCNASPCGDTLAPLIVLGASFTLRTARGSRIVPAEEFFLGPKATVLEPGEILESVLIPASHLAGRSAFRMIGKRNGQVISQVNVAVWLKRAEQLLRGKVPDPLLLQGAAKAVQEEIQPISDVRTSQAYRRSVSASLFMDVMNEVLEREGG
jgi:xanthine dehydrogenase FAD-binding subunit